MSVHIGPCSITGSLSLQAPVQELALRIKTLEGLDLPRGIFQILPSMLALRTLEIHTPTGNLPPLLPASLQVVRYIITWPSPFASVELQHLPAACHLPEVQSVRVYRYGDWTPSELSAIEKLAKESKANVIVKENWEEDKTIRGETFF